MTSRYSRALLCAVMVIGALSGPAVTTAAAAPPATDAAHLFLIVENIQDLRHADVRNRSDLDAFVSKMMGLQYRPDILLLGEVADESVSYIARKLTARTGNKYIAAVKPPDRPLRKVRRSPDRFELTDTAIVINSATVTEIRRGGYIRTKVKPGHLAPRRNLVSRRQAHTMVKHLPTGWVLPLMSVHWHARHEIKKAYDERYRGRWARQALSVMSRKYTAESAGIPQVRRVFGGDFNDVLCKESNYYTGKCVRALQSFYKVFKGSGFQDAVTRPQGVDHAFTKLEIAASGEVPGAYSNHNLRWMRLGHDDVGPMPPKDFSLKLPSSWCCGAGYQWKPPHDFGGVGVQKYEIQRRRGTTGPWELVSTISFSAEPPWFQWDMDVNQNTTYYYRARSMDRNGNWGAYSPSRSVTIPK